MQQDFNLSLSYYQTVSSITLISITEIFCSFPFLSSDASSTSPRFSIWSCHHRKIAFWPVPNSSLPCDLASYIFKPGHHPSLRTALCISQTVRSALSVFRSPTVTSRPPCHVSQVLTRLYSLAHIHKYVFQVQSSQALYPLTIFRISGSKFRRDCALVAHTPNTN